MRRNLLRIEFREWHTRHRPSGRKELGFGSIHPANMYWVPLAARETFGHWECYNEQYIINLLELTSKYILTLSNKR